MRRDETPVFVIAAALIAASGCADQQAGSNGATAPAVAPGATGATRTTNTATAPKTMQVTIAGEVFTLELATDPEARARGLMGRTEIPEHTGMLFAFPIAQVQEFWMGHCLVDMDIMFLDRTGRVTAKHTMKIEPPQRPNESDEAYRNRMRRYSSRSPAPFAIEIGAGKLETLGVRVGDKIPLDLDRLKAMAR